MSNTIKINQTFDCVPNLGTQFHWHDLRHLIETSALGAKITSKYLSKKEYDMVMFNKAIKTASSYARFDLDSYPYKIIRNEKLHFLPDISNTLTTTFDELTYSRALEGLHRSKLYDNIYVFYSGGIDSTYVLSAILANWPKEDLDKVSIVMTRDSINENPNMYENYIKAKFKIVDTSEFLLAPKRNNSSMYITGDLGDSMISNDMVHEFELMIPDVMNKSWKLHTDNIIRYFANSVKIEDTRNVLDTILDSIEKVGIEIETVHDIFWWMSFNWSYDFDLYSHLGFWKLTEDTDTKLFLEENYFPWLNTKGFQDYIVNPNNKKIGDTIESCKYPLKEYIYDFNKDTEYYKHKVHKDSLTMNTDFKSICCAVDEKYNIYYRNFIK